VSRAIKFTKAVAGEKPAVRIEFAGRVLNDYFSLRKIARDDFNIPQTTLARKIICEWLKRYREAVKNGEERAVRQMTLAIEVGNDKLRVMGNAQERKVEK